MDNWNLGFRRVGQNDQDRLENQVIEFAENHMEDEYEILCQSPLWYIHIAGVLKDYLNRSDEFEADRSDILLLTEKMKDKLNDAERFSKYDWIEARKNLDSVVDEPIS